MANAIAQALSDSVVLASGQKGPIRHAYDELTYLQSDPGDKALAAPYLAADHVTTIPAHTDTISSGNFTITLNFPKYSVTKTTANIAYNANASTIESAIDTAMAGVTLAAAWSDGDINVALTGNLTANAATVTFNGDSVTNVYCIVTTANVNLDADHLATPVVATVGTGNRPAEAVLKLFDVVKPSGTLPYQGQAANDTDYSTGGNPFSLSPGTVKLLIEDIIQNEDSTIGVAIRDAVDSVSSDS